MGRDTRGRVCEDGLTLDEYVKKQEERRRRLQTPPKRAAAFAAKLATGQQQQQQPSYKSVPKPVVFAPSVLSTTQINFSAVFKTPTSRTPFKPVHSTAGITHNVKENTSTPAANQSLLSTSGAARPVFDLKASLARPLTWTPHRGKLRPFAAAAHVDVKAVKPKTRDEPLMTSGCDI